VLGEPSLVKISNKIYIYYFYHEEITKEKYITYYNVPEATYKILISAVGNNGLESLPIGLYVDTKELGDYSNNATVSGNPWKVKRL